MGVAQRVFVDANVFFSKTQMDWLFFLRTHNESMFQLFSTEDVFAEVAANMRKKQPRLDGHHVRRRVELMREIVDEVLDTFPGDLPYSGTDPDDYHVHAAAHSCRAHLLLTNNSSTDITTEDQHYEVIHPDAFFILVARSTHPAMLDPIILEQMDYWSQKPSHRQLDEALRKAKCPEFAELVRHNLKRIARQGN